MRLRENYRNFPIPFAAVRGISGGWRELKFQAQNSNALIDQERVLHTGQNAVTSIAVSQPLRDAFYNTYRPGWFRKLIRRPKYFVLEYIVMVADKKCSVATVY